MYRLMPDGHTAIGNFDSGEPLPGKDDPTLNSFDSDFIDGEVDDVLTGVRPSFTHTLTFQNPYNRQPLLPHRSQCAHAIVVEWRQRTGSHSRRRFDRRTNLEAAVGAYSR